MAAATLRSLPISFHKSNGESLASRANEAAKTAMPSRAYSKPLSRGISVIRGWSGVRDSNPCKSAWKADARPLGQPRPGVSYSSKPRLLHEQRANVPVVEVGGDVARDRLFALAQHGQ